MKPKTFPNGRLCSAKVLPDSMGWENHRYPKSWKGNKHDVHPLQLYFLLHSLS